MKFMEDGTKIPMSIKWTDGTTFEIDRVLDVKKCASLKVGDRYTVRISGKETYLYYEFDKWFVEKKQKK